MITLLGDPVLDVYTFTTAIKISQEAPIPVLLFESYQKKLGGAANVFKNLTNLNLDVSYALFHSNHDSFSELQALLKSTENSLFYMNSLNASVPVKERIICDNQQVARLDRESKFVITESETHTLLQYLDNLPFNSIVLISDYNKSFIPRDVFIYLSDLAQERNLRILCDPHPENLHCCKNFYILTPNVAEISKFLGLEVTLQNYTKALDDLESLLHIKIPCITMGKDGVVCKISNEYFHFPTKAVEVFDVTGAGDTFISSLAASLSLEMTILNSIQIANEMASLSVTHLGTYAPTISEFYSVKNSY